MASKEYQKLKEKIRQYENYYQIRSEKVKNKTWKNAKNDYNNIIGQRKSKTVKHIINI